MSFVSYPRTPHLQGSGIQRGDSNETVPFSTLRGLYCVVEEKVDGANSGFSFDGAGDRWLQSRGSHLSLDPSIYSERHFRLFKQWVAAHSDDLLSRLEDRYVVYGEWMNALHSVYYDDLPHFFLEFDVWDRVEECFMSTTQRRGLLRNLPIASVPVLYRGEVTEEVLRSLHRPSLFQTENWQETMRKACAMVGDDFDRRLPRIFRPRLSEGFYIKVEDGSRCIARYKWVDPRFVQTILEHNVHWQSQIVVPNMLGVAVPEFPHTVVREVTARTYDADKPWEWVPC